MTQLKAAMPGATTPPPRHPQTSATGGAQGPAPASRGLTESSRRRDCTATRHGTVTAYNGYGCRCPDARAKVMRLQELRRLRALKGDVFWVAPWTAGCQLRALVAAGHHRTAIAAELATTSYAVYELIEFRHERITPATARKINALYRRWQDVVPTDTYAARTRRQAAERGWLPPVAWDFDTLGDPGYSDDRARALITRTPLTDQRDAKADRQERVAEMIAAGTSVNNIVAAIGCTRRTIERDLAELGISTAANGCGTTAGWRRHVEAGETPCADCREAHQEATRKRAQKAGKAA